MAVPKAIPFIEGKQWINDVLNVQLVTINKDKISLDISNPVSNPWFLVSLELTTIRLRRVETTPYYSSTNIWKIITMLDKYWYKVYDRANHELSLRPAGYQVNIKAWTGIHLTTGDLEFIKSAIPKFIGV